MYPNPTTGKFIIKSKQLFNTIKIVNLLGQEIYFKKNINKNNLENTVLLNQTNGIYNVVITFSDGTINTFKLIKI